MSRVLVTGGSGFLGSHTVQALALRTEVDLIVSADVREPAKTPAGVVVATCDVTDAAAVDALVAEHDIDTIVHLAAIVNPGTVDEAIEYAVDVDGTRNVLDAALRHSVRRLVVSSSGAAYGYHRDNPDWLVESDPIRGNDAFSYSRHKRLVEEMLADARAQHPELEQVILRIGTILGPDVSNQITALWKARRILAIRGSKSPFVFIWVEDVVGAIVRGATGTATGAFNVAGDGRVTIDEIADAVGTPTLAVPAWVLSLALRIGHALKLTVHGHERVGFLRYRPVLDNTRLKTELGYTPSKTSRQALDAYLASRRRAA